MRKPVEPRWPHDPRSATREPLCDEHDPRLINDGDMEFRWNDETKRYETLFTPPPALSSPPERTQAEEDAKKQAGAVLEAISKRAGNTEEHHAMLYYAMQNTDPVIEASWPDTLTVIGADPSGESKTVYQLWERNGKRLDWVTGGPVLRLEGDWQPGDVDSLVTPEREEFSAWLERNGLREEK